MNIEEKIGIIGKKGEDIASAHLKKNGYFIVLRNYAKKFGEIDIIAIDKDKTLVFIEVKTIVADENNTEFIKPEDNMTRSKINKLIKICVEFANKNEDLIREDSGWRIDLIAVEMKRNKTNGRVDDR